MSDPSSSSMMMNLPWRLTFTIRRPGNAALMSRGRMPSDSRLQNFDRQDVTTAKAWGEFADDGLNFREFGHADKCARLQLSRERLQCPHSLPVQCGSRTPRHATDKQPYVHAKRHEQAERLDEGRFLPIA